MEEKRASLAGIAAEVELTVKQYLKHIRGLINRPGKFHAGMTHSGKKKKRDIAPRSIFWSFAIC